MIETITIAGGGLAGLTLGIGLRQRGVSVKIVEAGSYPRHRVCGEFISGAGRGALARLDLLDAMRGAGCHDAVNAAFFSKERKIASRPLPDQALCISRFVLDDLLAKEFVRLGGELHCGGRWQGGFAPGIVRASGRRVETDGSGWRLFGLKAHATDVELGDDLEMHFVPDGYVGLCRLPGGEVNICGLFRSEAPVPDLAQRWQDWLRGPPGSILSSRLENAKMEEASFCSVAGFCLRPRRAARREEFCIGDSLTMIPPFTGNGMSMAFESAELAIEPLVQFCQGEMSWAQAQREAAALCDSHFGKRLGTASWLQWALFQPTARKALVFAASSSRFLWDAAFKSTR